MNDLIRKATGTASATGTVTNPLGVQGANAVVDGVGTSAQFEAPISITIDSSNAVMFVAECNPHVVRRIEITSQWVTTVIGVSGSSGMTSSYDPLSGILTSPRGLAFYQFTLFICQDHGVSKAY